MSESDQTNLLGEIRYETFTSGGPGGQHANRTASGVKAIHVPTGITAVAREHRSQHRNKELALERLKAKLKARHRHLRPRIPTRVPGTVRQRRLDEKKQRSRLKELRRKIDSD
jgi:protein subunit release factor A